MLLRPSRERIVKHCSVHSLSNHPFIDESYLENPDPFVRIVGSLPFTETFDLDNPLYNLNRSIAFVGTVNGLICLRSWRGRLILWNPSTREVRPVHDLIPPDTNGLFNSYTFMYGFGYDEVHDDYKIVAIYKNGPAIGLIYSLKNTSWRNLDVFERWLQYDQSAKFVNGKVHWVSGTTFTTGGDSFIMSIDLVDEKCGKVELPNYEEGEKELDLGVLGSDLSISCNHIKDHERTRIDVWVMKEYGVKESWMKLYSIKYCTFSGCYLTAPLCMWNKGESLFVSGWYVMIYDPEKKLIKYVEFTNAKGGLMAELYVESLVSPYLRNKPMTQH